MKKALSVTLAVSLVLATSALTANAAVKAGSACKGKGTIKISGAKTFTCIKVGKKLLWDKGVPSAKPAVQNSPSATPTPTPSVVPEVIPAVPTSFSNLLENSDGIAYAVWKNTRDNLEKYKTTDLKISITIGPNSTERYPASFTEEAIKLGSRVLGAQKQPKEVHFYQYTKADIKWAREQAAKYVSPFNLGISQLLLIASISHNSKARMIFMNTHTQSKGWSTSRMVVVPLRLAFLVGMQKVSLKRFLFPQFQRATQNM